MTSGQPKRKRGVVLTPTGRQKLQEAINAWEEQDNFGEKLTIEELSDRTQLDAGTVAKVLDCEEGVDRRTLERFFQALGLVLSEKDYSRPIPSVDKRPAKETRIDWGEAVDASIFYGRSSELETLEKWIVSDHCRLVTLLGMGGIGKTSLAAKLGEKLQNEFDYVVWRSLREAPPLKEILVSLVQFLSNQQETELDLPESLGGRITKLLGYFRSHRCLIILDNAESILQEGQVGVYREGYEGYGELLKRVGESSHQSCLLITSREKPRELSAIEGEALLVRSLQLRGIGGMDGKEILKAKGLNIPETSEGDELIHRCAGNPLALKLVATTIQDLFDGNIAEFLNQETIAFEGVRDLLDQHFNRLSDLEKSVMYWLAINREPVSLQELQEDIILSITKPKLLEALKGLIGRFLIEVTKGSYTQQAVIMEYITERLVEEICEEIKTQKITLFRHYALAKATSKDYIRNIQIRLILKVIVDRLLLDLGSRSEVEKRMKDILSRERMQSPKLHSYVSGNVLNILSYLNIDLSSFDFSNLKILQAYLQNATLHNVTFAGSEIIKSSFAEAIDNIFSVAFSPDGTSLAMGGSDGELRMLRVSDSVEKFVVREHTSTVWSVAFSQDGNHVVSSGEDKTVRLWDAHTGQCLQIFQGHTHRVRSAKFSLDGKTIASGSDDCTVKLWDVSSGQCLRTLDESTDRVRSIAFSPTNNTLAGSCDDSDVRLWNIHAGRCLRVMQDHTDRVRAVAFSPDGQIIASGSEDNSIRLWDANTGQCLNTLLGHTNRVRAVAFSPDGQIIASGSDDHNIKLWNTFTGQYIKTLQGHTNWVRSLSFNPTGQILASSSDDLTVRFWDIFSGQCLRKVQGAISHTSSVAINSDNTVLASGGNDSAVRLWDLRTGSCIKTLQEHTNRAWSVAFSPDGTLLASGSNDQTVRLWDVQTGKCLRVLRGHGNWVRSVAFSLDGKLLASGSDDHSVRIWDVNTGRCIQTLQGKTHRAWSVAFSPDGTLIASGSNDEQTLRLWDVQIGECLKVLHGHTSRICSVSFSPKGNFVASGSEDYTIRFWDPNTGRCFKILKDHNNWIYSIAFSPNGLVFASGDTGQTIKLWDMRTFQCFRTLQGDSQGGAPIAFSSDNQTLVSGGGRDATIRVWNIQTGKCSMVLRTLRPYEGMNITGVTGLTEAQKASLIALGAIESE